MRREFVEVTRAVVPIHADLMRAAARTRQSEPEPKMPAVKMTRRERELAELSPDRALVERTIVSAERVFVAVQKRTDRSCGQLAVFERARDTLAHQRIDSGRVAGQDDSAA